MALTNTEKDIRNGLIIGVCVFIVFAYCLGCITRNAAIANANTNVNANSIQHTHENI